MKHPRCFRLKECAINQRIICIIDIKYQSCFECFLLFFSLTHKQLLPSGCQSHCPKPPKGLPQKPHHHPTLLITLFTGPSHFTLLVITLFTAVFCTTLNIVHFDCCSYTLSIPGFITNTVCIIYSLYIFHFIIHFLTLMPSIRGYLTLLKLVYCYFKVNLFIY